MNIKTLIDEGRVGFIRVNRSIFWGMNPKQCFFVLAQGVVLNQTTVFEHGSEEIVYTVASEAFRSIPAGEVIPEYRVIVNSAEGLVSHEEVVYSAKIKPAYSCTKCLRQMVKAVDKTGQVYHFCDCEKETTDANIQTPL